MADESEGKKDKQEKRGTDSVPEESAAQPAAPAVEGTGSGDEAAHARRAKLRGIKSVPVGVAHIRATFNNTSVSIADMKGNVIAWSSAGRAGFKGSRKSTAFAATMVGQDAAKQAVARGMHEVEIHVQGAGAGRESAIRAIQAAGLNISLIRDVTPVPHNGCRPRKRRRV